MSVSCQLFLRVPLSLFLLTLSAALLSCGGTCTDQIISSQVREIFMDFKPGSYWIYRNVANGDLDSVYFVAQTLDSLAGGRKKGTPVCIMEEANINYKGFAKVLPFGYHIKSWDNEMEINTFSAIAFRGNYELTKLENKVLQGVTYNEVTTLTHCCLSGCNSACNEKYFRFLKLSFAPRIGLVSWEAENHPQFGNVTYELVRYKVIR